MKGHTPREDGTGTTVLLGDGREVPVSVVVVSVGRRPRTEGLLSAGTAVLLDERGFVVANEFQQTHEQYVWAVGDVVAGSPQLAHVGFAEAIAVVKGILGEPVVPVDYDRVPWAIYCHPEVAFAGLTEAQARAAGMEVVTVKDPFGGNSRARIIGDTEGLVKVVAERLPDGTAGPDRRRPHGRPVGDRAARRGVPGGQLGGDARRGGAVPPTPPVALRDLRRGSAGPDRKGAPRWLTSRCRSWARR